MHKSESFIIYYEKLRESGNCIINNNIFRLNAFIWECFYYIIVYYYIPDKIIIQSLLSVLPNQR